MAATLTGSEGAGIEVESARLKRIKESGVGTRRSDPFIVMPVRIWRWPPPRRWKAGYSITDNAASRPSVYCGESIADNFERVIREKMRR